MGWDGMHSKREPTHRSGGNKWEHSVKNHYLNISIT
jgi:hypothetical protein